MRSPMIVAAGPETRTTPTPPRPGAVAIATMVSVCGVADMSISLATGMSVGPASALEAFAIKLAGDDPLLRDADHAVDDPVQHEAGLEEREERGQADRHDLHPLLLHRLHGLEIGRAACRERVCKYV